VAQEIPGTHLVGQFSQKAFIVKDAKVLMTRGLDDNTLDLPGGRLHIGEDLTQGLMREVREELGIEVEIGEPFHINIWYEAPEGTPRIQVVYLVTLANPAAPLTVAKDELEEVRWIGREDIETSNVHPDWKPPLYKFFAAQSFVRKSHK
jgi:8-oxo-dGTP diphosphatase